MQELINALSNPGAMSSAQWLILGIGAFIVLGSLYFILKLFKLIRSIGKTSYKPNIGLSRHPYQGQPVSKSTSEPGESDESDESDESSKDETANNDAINESDAKTE
jgi:hypothetical protein